MEKSQKFISQNEHIFVNEISLGRDCVGILVWFLAGNHFIRFIVDLEVDFLWHFEFKRYLFLNFRVQATTFLSRTHFCNWAELGDPIHRTTHSRFLRNFGKDGSVKSVDNSRLIF